MSTIPTITEQVIRTFVGEQNFLKGQHYVRDGAIVDPVQQGMMLKAYCYGSLPEPYRVQVTFDGSDITAALCSCSAGTPTYGTRGCEHATALLLTWHMQPEAFTQMDDIDTILERQSKAQLITLVKQLLQKQPEVEWQLTMLPLSGYKSVPIDTLADLFVQYGQDAAVERMMYEKAQQEMYTITAEWLKTHYLAKNNLAAAFEMAELIFRKRPWFVEYQKMREISMELGNWEAVRQKTHMFLETTKNISTLVEAALDEGDIERALQLLQATKPLALRAISGSTTMRALLKLLLKPLNARKRHTLALR